MSFDVSEERLRDEEQIEMQRLKDLEMQEQRCEQSDFDGLLSELSRMEREKLEAAKQVEGLAQKLTEEKLLYQAWEIVELS